MIPIPKSRPKASRELVLQVAKKQFEKDYPGKAFPKWFVLAVRAYYSQTIAPEGNNISAYDDAFFIVGPNGEFSSWNGNTDPSRYGYNNNAGKYMARLKPGSYTFQRVFHRGRYWAFGQAGNPVTVERIDSKGRIRQTETGCFGINNHLGGYNGTSSEGCPTLPPEQWPKYYKELAGIIKSSDSIEFDFILTDGPIN